MPARADQSSPHSAGVTNATDAPDSTLAIYRGRYLLVMQLPHYVEPQGGIWLERLWHRDLIGHLPYLPHLTLVSPRLTYEEGRAQGIDLICLDMTLRNAPRIEAIPPMGSLKQALRGLLKTVQIMWRLIGESDVVHSGMLGWPYPLGWVANPMAMIRRRKLLLVLESTPWRWEIKSPRFAVRCRGYLTEWLGRFFARHCDVIVATHPEFLNSLAEGVRARCEVQPASWISDEQVLTDEQAQRAWDEKDPSRGGPLRFLFAARLTESKGVRVLLEALDLLARRRPTGWQCEIIGEGELRGECQAAAARHPDGRVRVLDPLPYGAPFFDLVRQQHLLVLANLGEEQPRAAYDAFSQAVPVLSSITPGVVAFIFPDRNGFLIPAGDAARLAAQLDRLIAQPEPLRSLGMSALGDARRYTHATMHAARSRLIVEAFGPGLEPSAKA